MRYTRLNTLAEVQDLIEFHNSNSQFVVIDVETTSVNPRKAQLIDVQLSGRDEDHAVIFDADKCHVLGSLKPEILFVAHNYKYDAHVLFLHGVNLLERTWRDTLLMTHLADENRESYGLDSIVKEKWNDPYKEEFWKKYESYQEAPQEERDIYATKDIYYTARLYRKLCDFNDRTGIPSELTRHTHRLQACLLATEIQGIEVDTQYLTKLGAEIQAKLYDLVPKMRDSVRHHIALWELEAYQAARDSKKTEKGKDAVEWPEFNFASSSQLKWLLYRSLELPVQKNEKTKQVSTDYAALENIKDKHEVIPLIQEYRDLSKVYTAFIEGTNDRIDNGRIYPEFRVSGTKTGRISHSNPNLGQLPKSGGIRGIYRAAKDHVLISADYSQLEVCIEANVTGDPSLERIFREGLSKHDITANALKIDRHAAKTLNFALQYWASHYKVAKLLGVSEDEGKKIWEDYWQLYSGPKRLKARTDEAVDSGTPIVTLFGRKRRFEYRKRSVWDADYRQAYNFLIQGTGADITSRAFYLTSEELSRRGWGRGLFTVHDEILIEVKKEVAKEAEELMLNTMVSVGNDIGLKIPLKAESSGPMTRWED